MLRNFIRKPKVNIYTSLSAVIASTSFRAILYLTPELSIDVDNKILYGEESFVTFLFALLTVLRKLFFFYLRQPKKKGEIV